MTQPEAEAPPQPERSDSETSAAIYAYRPVRALLFWLMVGAAVVALLRLAPTAGGARSAAATSAAGGLAAGIVSGIWRRSLADPYCQIMLAGAIGILLYGAAQWVAVARETTAAVARTERRPAEPAPSAAARIAADLLARLTGRPSVDSDALAANLVHVRDGIDLLLYPLRYAQTLFPAIGFVGTVIGISGAVRALPDVIRNHAVDELLRSLHVAFDTTFLGLVTASLVGIMLVLGDLRYSQLKSLHPSSVP
jgi:hypothetical protein